MKLKDLVEITGVPASSIKFYLRHDLLHPGEKLNATTARYGYEHVERLELIKALRQVIGLSLEQCARLVTAVNAAETVTTVVLMGEVQTVVQEFLGESPGPSPSGEDRDADSAGDAVRDHPPTSQDTRLTANDIVNAMGWLSGTDESMVALDQELHRMALWGLAPHLDSALVYARAVDAVAAHQLRIAQDRRGLEEWERMADRGGASGDESVSRDQLAMYVALGVYSYSRFLLKLLAVAQGSHARSSPADDEGNR